jgi:hypothetical protein
VSVRVSVCTLSLIYGQIWTLKVPMDFLGQGGPSKTIYKVIGPEMKKKIIWDTFFKFTSY